MTVHVAQCRIYTSKPDMHKEDTYFGQTVTSFNTRMNGHRNKFVINLAKDNEKSALSLHCFKCHKTDFHMNIFPGPLAFCKKAVERVNSEKNILNR